MADSTHAVADEARRACSIVALAVLWLLGGATGCATKVYRVAQLPAEYLAPPVVNTQEADLTGLAAPTVSSDLIEHGDVLEVTVETGYTSGGPRTYPVRVADNGTANVPLVGYVPVAGLELEEAEQLIAAAAVERQVYRQPLVTVTMKRRRTNRITVLGAVEKPGVYEMPRGASSLLYVLATAGGRTEQAGTDVVIRRPPRRLDARIPPSRPPGRRNRYPETAASAEGARDGMLQHGPSVLRINLVEAAQQGRSGWLLEDGDKVMVVKRDPKPVTVLGLVKNSAQYELPVNKDLRLLDALGLAGGVTSPVADKIRIIRHPPDGGPPVIIQVGLQEAKTKYASNLRLAQGDVISVEHTPATVVLDTLRSFIRFGVSSSIPLF